MTLQNNRAPLLCCFQLCAWFHCHMWIQTGVRVRKRLSWVLTSVTLTFDLWPWPFAWTSLLTMVITPENFMMIRWWEHGEQDRRWNADKPSAALDPYIPTWLTTSSTNHRPANFWKSFFFFLKHWKEIVKSCAISCWTDVDQFQIWSFHSLILEVQIITDIIYQSIMGMFTYFHSMSLRCSYCSTWFSVLPIYIDYYWEG